DAAAYYGKCLQIDSKSATVMYELANIYIMQGDYATAASLTKQAVKINPENIWYKLLLAALYERMDLLDEASAIYKDLAHDYPERIDLQAEYAGLLTAEGKLKDAIKIYDKLEQQFGVTDEINMEKEKLYLSMKDYENAYNELNKLIEAFPFEARYYGLLAEIYVSNNQFDKALATYTKLLEADPDNGLGFLSLSEYYRITDDEEASYSYMKKAFASPDVDIDLKVKMILRYYSPGENPEEQKQKAYELLDLMAATHPTEAKALAVYGDFLVRDKRYEESREKFRKVIEIEKNNYIIWEQLLMIETFLADYKALYLESREALEYFPNQPLVFLYNGIGASRQKKYDEAVESLMTGLGLIAGNEKQKAQFYVNLGETYYKMKEYEKSDEYFDKSLEINPDDAYVLNNYSYYLALRGEKLDKAIKMSMLCNEIEENNGTYLDTWAWTLYRAERYSEALDVIRKALDNGGGGSATIIEHYGDILYKNGKKDEALEQWKKALEKGKGSEFLEKKAAEGILYE
ncbi:MAG: tetratricopeptide repeat protein, partial [Bacteroidota bacterium]